MLGSWAARIGLFSLVLASAGLASAQVKIGVVNIQKAILDTAAIKKASAELETKYKPRQDQGQRLQTELQQVQQQLQSGAGKLSNEQQTELQTQSTRKQRELQRLSEDLQQDFNNDRNEILQKASANMQAIVRKLAEDKGLDAVFDSTNAFYFKPALDLTADATTAYNAAHPAQ